MRGQLLACLLAALLTGCINPIPHDRRLTPVVEGVVMRGVSPVAGAEVLLSSSLSGTPKRTVTDAAGHFSVGPVTEFVWMQLLVGDPMFHYSLDITAGGQSARAFDGGSMGTVKPTLTLRCDLGIGPPEPMAGEDALACRDADIGVMR